MTAIPYRHSSGIELRFCLRSIEMFAPNEQVTIIGELPGWCDNVCHIPFLEKRDAIFKEQNILRKLLLMEEDFFYFNDDFYLLAPLLKEVHYSGLLAGRLYEFEPGNPFKNTILNTIQLGATYNHHRHGPMFINRNKFEKITRLKWDKEWGYCIKSVYSFMNGITGIDYPDLKIRTEMSRNSIFELIKDREYFSNNEASMNRQMLSVLKELYPQKSKFEK